MGADRVGAFSLACPLPRNWEQMFFQDFVRHFDPFQFRKFTELSSNCRSSRVKVIKPNVPRKGYFETSSNERVHHQRCGGPVEAPVLSPLNLAEQSDGQMFFHFVEGVFLLSYFSLKRVFKRFCPTCQLRRRYIVTQLTTAQVHRVGHTGLSLSNFVMLSVLGSCSGASSGLRSGSSRKIK